MINFNKKIIEKKMINSIKWLENDFLWSSMYFNYLIQNNFLLRKKISKKYLKFWKNMGKYIPRANINS